MYFVHLAERVTDYLRRLDGLTWDGLHAVVEAITADLAGIVKAQKA